MFLVYFKISSTTYQPKTATQEDKLDASWLVSLASAAAAVNHPAFLPITSTSNHFDYTPDCRG